LIEGRMIRVDKSGKRRGLGRQRPDLLIIEGLALHSVIRPELLHDPKTHHVD